MLGNCWIVGKSIVGLEINFQGNGGQRPFLNVYFLRRKRRNVESEKEGSILVRPTFFLDNISALAPSIKKFIDSVLCSVLSNLFFFLSVFEYSWQ